MSRPRCPGCHHRLPAGLTPGSSCSRCRAREEGHQQRRREDEARRTRLARGASKRGLGECAPPIEEEDAP